jgi:hypothetical protein
MRILRKGIDKLAKSIMIELLIYSYLVSKIFNGGCFMAMSEAKVDVNGDQAVSVLRKQEFFVFTRCHEEKPHLISISQAITYSVKDSRYASTVTWLSHPTIV